eukprot:TRINITY_DN5131_c0_g2_i1.p1 TRINITY_DN5131_c0_g2~~TRINITY_DN5131_c0_g2_i1.p1  ORF type:complete len:431 (+),score=58.62 TRINITY_DN5131_c0_g2_i1:356-1648(+)
MRNYVEHCPTDASQLSEVTDVDEREHAQQQLRRQPEKRRVAARCVADSCVDHFCRTMESAARQLRTCPLGRVASHLRKTEESISHSSELNWGAGNRSQDRNVCPFKNEFLCSGKIVLGRISVLRFAMSGSRVHSKIFWPSHYLSAPSGYIIGWNIRGFIGCVATIVSGVELDEVQSVLRELAENQDLKRQSPAGPPIVLGQWLADGGASDDGGVGPLSDDGYPPGASPGPDFGKLNDESIWFTIERDARSRCPRLREIFCYGYRYHTTSHVIFYTQPSPRHFFSVQPLNADPSAYPLTPDGGCPEEHVSATELEESLRQINSSSIIEKLVKEAIASRLQARRAVLPAGAKSSAASVPDGPPARATSNARPQAARTKPQRRSFGDTISAWLYGCIHWLLWLLEYEIPMYGKLKDLTSVGELQGRVRVSGGE